MPKAFCVILILAACVSNVRAQANPDSVQLRNDCRLASQVLTTGQPSPHRQHALTVIGRCGREAVPALASTWSTVEADRPTLGLLVTSTRSYADEQLVDALFGTLNQVSRPLDVRAAALLVLITYADPSVVPGLESFVGDSSELLVSRYGAVSHPFPVVGREALAGSLVERLRTTLTAMASSDPNAGMRLAARVAMLNRPLM